uniref:BRISC and BRCA1-A complex member 2 n=1 Tax=Ananas comosus var. bracteatus TaxID=296719 RepID=A0A6V7PI23_ANACO|nr:unnamed protein product [Ananas comosus var. bracteatus]
MAAADPSLPPQIAAQLNYLLSHSPLPSKGRDLQRALPRRGPDFVFAPDDDGFRPLGGGAREEGPLLRTAVVASAIGIAETPRVARRRPRAAYQKKRVEELDDARLKFEISTILSREGIEVCVVSPPDRPAEVKFAVPLLDLDFDKLVREYPWKHQQKIFLQVVYPVSRSYSSIPSAPRIKLVSTSDLKALFSIEDVKLPPWLDGMCMAEYLPTVEDNLKVQVVEAVASIGQRRRFIEALSPLLVGHWKPIRSFVGKPRFLLYLGFYISEVTGKFVRVVIQLELQLIHFSIPIQFPKQQPILTLQSSQHFNSQGTPILSPPINDYPWSPRWDPAKMVERIFDFLVDECLNFKKYCNDAIPQQQ